jgi:ribosomal protein S1
MEMPDAYEIISQLDDKNYQFDEPNAMDNWSNYGFIKKDVSDGDIIKISKLNAINDDKFSLLLENGLSMECNIKKERKFFEINQLPGRTVDDYKEWLNTDDAKQWFEDNDISVKLTVDNFRVEPSLLDAFVENKRYEFIKETKKCETPYSAKIISKNNGGFLVEIDGVEAFLPGGQAAANKIVNFNELIGKNVMVMIEDYIREGDTFIVSNKKYIQYILPKKTQELDLQKQYNGLITGSISSGIFIEFDEMFTGLLHISEMRMETQEKFRNSEYKPGDEISFYIKEVVKGTRLILSDFEPIDAPATLEDFKLQCEGTTIEGEIINIKPLLGLFIKFNFGNNKFIGLLHYKEIKDIESYQYGDKISVYISKVIPDVKKIFLKIPYEKSETK